ncbi:60S ribosomal protein L44 [Plasmodium falciparum Palo Alto/Uganda]|uniref:60S ribosomal protein L44 n=1 Tax=Plasmodium falciparum (isolate Palo Alto / Uganda) TaxID=57270 RepID=W4IS64_PLAFP|nr:60S ribosomal protein L44 [Plasmodium falciparum Palo Alto/Uganda]
MTFYFECTKCKKKRFQTMKRCKTFEMGADKKKKGGARIRLMHKYNTPFYNINTITHSINIVYTYIFLQLIANVIKYSQKNKLNRKI